MRTGSRVGTRSSGIGGGLALLVLLGGPAVGQTPGQPSAASSVGCTATTAATAGACVKRDTNANAFSNNILSNSAITTASGGNTILTAGSGRYQALSGSTSQTYTLPDAQTLSVGPWFVFNNGSSGTLTINKNGGALQTTVAPGGFTQCGPLGIGTAAGIWDCHGYVPSTVLWGTGAAGLQLNTALSTTPQIMAGASSCTAPSFIPQRANATTGFGGTGSTVCWVVGGVKTLESDSTTVSAALPLWGSASGAGTSASITARANDATYAWYSPNGGTDAKLWDAHCYSTGGVGNECDFRAVNDANSGANSWLVVVRSGITISSIGLNSAAFSINGTAGVSCSGAPTASFQTVLGIVTHC